MLGAIAGVYPIPENIAIECEKRLTPDLLKILHDFEKYINDRNSINPAS